MELTNEFSVAAPMSRAWAVLTEVELIAPCLPGAQLQEIDGDEYKGIVKVKVGPITAQYKGKATFVEQDQAAGRVVLKADGRDTRGQGTASAVITAQLADAGDGTTKVTVITDLTVTGKVAQFGRGVMADVSAKLMEQFADNLAAVVGDDVVGDDVVGDDVVVDVTEPGPPSREPTPESARRLVDLPEPEPIDLMATAGAPMMKRIVPAVGVVALLLLILRALRKRS